MRRHKQDNRLCAGALVAVIALMLLTLLSGCTKRVYVPVETRVLQTDTVYSAKVRVDSVMLRDSVTLVQRGDTVYLTKYRDRYRVRERVDTLYQSVTDSVKVRVPYPVERGLTRWEQTKIDYGGEAITALAVTLIAAVVWLIKKFRK